MKKLITMLIGLMLITGSAVASMSNVNTLVNIGTDESVPFEMSFSLDAWTDVVIYAGVDGVDAAASNPTFVIYDAERNPLGRESTWDTNVWADDVVNFFGFVPDERSAAAVVGIGAGDYILHFFSMGNSGNACLLLADYATDTFDLTKMCGGAEASTDREIENDGVQASGLDDIIGVPYVGQPGQPGDCIYYTNSGPDNAIIGPCGQ